VIPSKAIFVISVLISGLIFSPSYSFAQSNQDENPLSSLFEIFSQLFSFDDEPPEPVIEFGDAIIVQTSGTSSTTDTTENNLPPMANAGPDQDDVMEFAIVTLDGSSSTDLDGNIVSYKWTQLSGAEVTLSSMSAVKPTFQAPDVTLQEILTFMLAVVDNSNDTDIDSVNITVNEKNENSPPTADAGPDQTVLEFATVTLDGSSSTDVDGNIVSYKWTQVSGTTVTLSSMTHVKPTFTAPDVDSPDNILKFLLAVVDNSSGTDTDEVIITVNENNDNPGGGGPGDDGPGDDGPGDDGPGDDGPGDDGSGDDGPGDNTPVDDGPKGNDNDGERKITVCHVPPGNPDNSHTIRIGEPAVLAHVAHGDTIGSCRGDPSNENFSSEKSKNENENRKDNSGKGNSEVDNSGKDNKNNKKDDNEKKSNSGKGNKDKNDDHENTKDNSGKGNSGVDNSDKGNQNKNKEKKSNSKLNTNDDEAKDEDDGHEDDDENEDVDEDDDEDDNENEED